MQKPDTATIFTPRLVLRAKQVTQRLPRLVRLSKAETAANCEVREALDRAAEEFGRELSEATDEVEGLNAYLERQGFEPFEDGDSIRLRNCPFHRLARQHTELICGMNLSMLSGALTAIEAGYEARLDPAPRRPSSNHEPVPTGSSARSQRERACATSRSPGGAQRSGHNAADSPWCGFRG